MRFGCAAGVLAALAVAVPVQAQDLPQPLPSARDLYVSCYLLVNKTDVPRGDDGKAPLYSMATCGLVAITMIATRESAAVESPHKFCLDKGAATSTDPATAMAYTYLDFYERNAFRRLPDDGRITYLMAMKDRWPCPPQ